MQRIGSPPPITRPGLGFWLGLLALGGCAPAVNLTQLEGPRFEGQYAPSPVVLPPMGAPSPADFPVTSTVPLRVVTFNIKLSRGIDSAIQLLEREPLREADIIALEEMDDTGVERIAHALGLNYLYFPASIHPTDHKLFGPAVLARWPIERGWKLILPHPGSARHQRRTATAAIVRIRGRLVRVYAVHLETQTQVSRAEHRDQAATILADAAQSPDPVVIAGDFNSYEIGRYLERQGYRWPTERVGRSVMLFSWDHIFTRGLAAPPVPAAGVVRNNLGASDHHPVWADVLLQNTAGPVPPS